MSNPSKPSMPLDEQRGQTLPRIVSIMQRLLSDTGCPWDREQTLETLRPYVIEEAHEVVDAIDRNDADDLREELGDLLLQIVFQSELARSKGWFGPDDVVDAISDKMVRRHPHVFGEGLVKLETSKEVLEAWERRKQREREETAAAAQGDVKVKGALDGVPVGMPALLRGVRIGDKAARVGYDWPSAAGARAKVDEELSELDEAVASGDATRMEEELGDVLFALTSWSRLAKVDPEAALRGTLDRFTKRFQRAEAIAREDGKALDQLGDAARDALWERVKKE
jgi:MazG family protein